MTLNYFIALLAAVAIQANPTTAAIPSDLYSEEPPQPLPELVEVRAPVIPVKTNPEALGIQTSAKGAIVVDVSSGSVVYAKQAELELPIASLTKLMTAMVILDRDYRPDEPLVIAPEDIEPIGRHWFDAGESLDRKTAFKAMLVQSINEVANAFARSYPGGEEAFVAAMNEKAHTLGLEHASFVGPSGIDADNKASALDVARMLRSAIAYPEIREATERGTFSVVTTGGRTVRIDPTNNLLTSYLNQDPYKIIAGKTGSLPEAGYCLGQVTKHPDGQQLITVVLGSNNHFGRFQEVKALTAWVFDVFSWE